MNGLGKFQKAFHDICAEKKEKDAIIYFRKNGCVERCSYAEMQRRVEKRAEIYRTLGIKSGNRVAVLSQLCMDEYLTILSLAYIGATSVIVDVSLHEKELVRILGDADVSCILTVQAVYEDKLRCMNKPVIDISDAGEWVKKGNILSGVDVDYEAIAILYSSGTTNQAKGVVIGYEQELKAVRKLLQVVGTSNIRYLMLFPNSHISGFTSFLALVLGGGELATMEDASASQLAKGFQIYRPNTFGMVPKVWETLKRKIEEGIQDSGRGRKQIVFALIKFCGMFRRLTGINIGRLIFRDINDAVFGGNLQQAHFGGGKSNREVTEFFWNIGLDIYDFYASTETNLPVLIVDGKKYQSNLGNINSNSDVKIRIANKSSDGTGEIQIKSNMMMLRYFRSPELTEATFEDGYLKTGDYGKIVNEQLYITGRMKESIHLANGEKVSPEDIEHTYKSLLETEIEFAVVGIPSDEAYDEVYLFVVGIQGQFDKEFDQINRQVASNYCYKKIIYVETLPKTSVGKIKRYQLRESCISNNMFGKSIRLEDNKNITIEAKNEAKLLEKQEFFAVIHKYTDANEVLESSRLEDLGMDSLCLFELFLELEQIFHTAMPTQLEQIQTVGELRQCFMGKCKGTDELDYSKYPCSRTLKQEKSLLVLLKKIRSIYEIQVNGIENFPKDTNCIICSNHASYLDPFFLLAAFGEDYIRYKRCATLAAIHTLRENFKLFSLIGGIPVEREGNTLPAMARCRWCLSEGYDLILFPEGKRSRDGSMLPFKSGATELAIQNHVPILPIYIDGAFEIFPRHKKHPRRYDYKRKQKLQLQIIIGKPLFPQNMDATMYTNRLKETIKELGKAVYTK